ncbi:hypothetical protein ACFL2Y_04950 [Candidatus Omnitrophota bacterium]
MAYNTKLLGLIRIISGTNLIDYLNVREKWLSTGKARGLPCLPAGRCESGLGKILR